MIKFKTFFFKFVDNMGIPIDLEHLIFNYLNTIVGIQRKIMQMKIKDKNTFLDLYF